MLPRPLLFLPTLPLFSILLSPVSLFLTGPALHPMKCLIFHRSSSLRRRLLRNIPPLDLPLSPSLHLLLLLLRRTLLPSHSILTLPPCHTTPLSRIRFYMPGWAIVVTFISDAPSIVIKFPVLFHPPLKIVLFAPNAKFVDHPCPAGMTITPLAPWKVSLWTWVVRSMSMVLGVSVTFFLS